MPPLPSFLPPLSYLSPPLPCPLSLVCAWCRDVNDLWSLELLPARAASQSSRRQPHVGSPAPDALQEEAFNVDVFKARQARACAVIHATPSAENKSGMSLHDLVRIAACGEEVNEQHSRANLMLSQLVI